MREISYISSEMEGYDLFTYTNISDFLPPLHNNNAICRDNVSYQFTIQ